jgi:hypothetical protein
MRPDTGSRLLFPANLLRFHAIRLIIATNSRDPRAGLARSKRRRLELLVDFAQQPIPSLECPPERANRHSDDRDLNTVNKYASMVHGAV